MPLPLCPNCKLYNHGIIKDRRLKVWPADSTLPNCQYKCDWCGKFYDDKLKEISSDDNQKKTEPTDHSNPGQYIPKNIRHLVTNFLTYHEYYHIARRLKNECTSRMEKGELANILYDIGMDFDIRPGLIRVIWLELRKKQNHE